MAAPRRNPRKPRVLDDDEIPIETLDRDSERYFKEQEDLTRAVDQLGEAGEGGRVNVYRQGVGGHRDIEFLDEYTPGEFSIKAVQRDYGAGIYRAHVQDAGGVMVANKSFRVGKPRRGEVPASIAANTPAALPSAPASSDLVTFMQTMQATMIAGFKEIAQAIQPPKQGLGVEEAIKLMAAVRGMQPEHVPENGAHGLGALKQLSEILEVIEDIRGPVDGKGNVSMLGVLSRALDKLADPLGEVIATVAKNKIDKTPALAAALAAPDSPTTETRTMTPQQQREQIVAFLPMLIAQAAADNDPATYAEMLIDNVAEADIRPWLERADWFDELQKMDERVKPYQRWFEEFRECVAEGLTPPADASTTAAQSPRAGDAATGGKSGS